VELAADPIVLVFDPERRPQTPDRVRRIGGCLSEHRVDRREVREPAGLEASVASLERDGPQVRAVTVRRADRLDRLSHPLGARWVVAIS
jgi:hypothetical protein